MANEDRNFKRESQNIMGQFFYGEKNDPVYRRKNGQHSRNVAQSLITSKRLVGKRKRQLMKRDTRKRVEANG